LPTGREALDEPLAAFQSATVELRRRFPASRTPKLPRVRRMTKAKLRG